MIGWKYLKQTNDGSGQNLGNDFCNRSS